MLEGIKYVDPLADSVLEEFSTESKIAKEAAEAPQPLRRVCTWQAAS